MPNVEAATFLNHARRTSRVVPSPDDPARPGRPDLVRPGGASSGTIGPAAGRPSSSGPSRPRPPGWGEQGDEVGTPPATPSSRSSRPYKGRDRTGSPAL